jgi:hypothetical protein
VAAAGSHDNKESCSCSLSAGSRPLVLGLPFLLAWIVIWILLTSVIMAVIYAADPANRTGEP